MISGLLCGLIQVYMLVLIARAVTSWFPVRPGSPFASVTRVLIDLTEPVLAPIRRVIPPAGMFDLSFMVLFFGLVLVRGAICGR